jgi:hypothetical protein
MNTRRLTKKYKYKNRNKKTRRNRKSRRSGKTRRRGRSGKSGRSGRTRRRILKGGVRQSVIPSVTGPSVRPRPSTGSFRPIIGTPFKTQKETILDKIEKKEEIKKIDEQIQIEIQIEIKTFIDLFFKHLKILKFPEALCALHTFYTCGIDISDINKVISSAEFKIKYDETFFKEVQKDSHTNIVPQERLMFFLSYIFKKIVEGATIFCSPNIGRPGIYLKFTAGPDSFLKTLKKFFGYLDTACVLTISYSITQEKIDIIYSSGYNITSIKPDEVTYGELALYDLVRSLMFFKEKIHDMKNDITQLLTLMTRGDGDDRIYSFNTTNMCTLIKMTERLFTYFGEPQP